MENLKKLQRMTLGLIIALVWFEILCFLLIFLGNIFKWSFLSETFSVGFFSAFGVGLGALAALAILHMTLTLNSISFSLDKMSLRSRQGEASRKKDKFFQKIIFAAIGTMFVIVIFLWYGEARVNKHKIKVTKNSLESIAISPIAAKAIEQISQDVSVREFLATRDVMMNTLEEARGLSLLIPMSKADKEVFYEATPWWWSSKDEELNKPLSKASLRMFVPYDSEKKKFNELLRNKKPFYSLERNSLRVFYPVTQNGEIKLILLLDTTRQESDAYLLKRGYRK